MWNNLLFQPINIKRVSKRWCIQVLLHSLDTFIYQCEYFIYLMQNVRSRVIFQGKLFFLWVRSKLGVRGPSGFQLIPGNINKIKDKKGKEKEQQNFYWWISEQFLPMAKNHTLSDNFLSQHSPHLLILLLNLKN